MGTEPYPCRPPLHTMSPQERAWRHLYQEHNGYGMRRRALADGSIRVLIWDQPDGDPVCKATVLADGTIREDLLTEAA